jgi:4-amino-4-deoxy-L-arabinose transferase-like glycosyltransferase
VTARAPLAITLAAGLVRLGIGATTPLFPDETYYWEWSRRLAAGYYDHPPVIALLIRGGTAIAGDTPLGVRLFPIIAGVVAAIFLVASARRIGGDRAALITAMIFAILPLSAAGLILATPDAPLLAGAAAMLYCVQRAIEQPPRTRDGLAWWSASGVALGLAMDSKYTAVLVPLGIFAAFLVRRDLRPRLRDAGPYVATVIGIAIFSPVIIWNSTHDWASFAFQLGHGLRRVSGSIVNRELELIGGQLGLVTPVLFVMMAIAVGRGLRISSLLPPSSSLLPLTATFIFAFFVYSATKRRVEANWPALAYLPAMLLLASHTTSQAWNRWLKAGIALAGVVTLATYVNSFAPILPVPARRDPVARSAGWDDLARAVNELYAPKLPISSYRTWVAAIRYQEASELAFHLPNHPRDVFALSFTSRPSQYDLWHSFPQRAYRRDGMILVADDVEGRHPAVELLAPHFERVTRADQVVLARNGDPVKYLRIWVLERWLGTWPTASVR